MISQREDKVSRPHRLWLRYTRCFVTDAGGRHTFETVDLCEKQQIMKASMQRLKTLPVAVTTADTSDSDAIYVPEKVNLASTAAADDRTQAEVPAAANASVQRSSAAGPLTEHCLAADLSDRRVQVQQEHTFADAPHCHRGHLSLNGSLSLVYHCEQGPKEEQTSIRHYIPLGDLALKAQHSWMQAGRLQMP